MLQGFKAEEATPHRLIKCMQSEKEKDYAVLWFLLVFGFFGQSVLN